MNRLSKRLTILAAASLLASVTPALAQEATLPNREGPRPVTTNSVPHIQLDIQAVPELTAMMLKHVGELSGVTLGATRVSLPGAVGFQLNAEVILA